MLHLAGVVAGFAEYGRAIESDVVVEETRSERVRVAQKYPSESGDEKTNERHL